ncbi:MAG: hypothetical protein NTW19_00690 [Planctomycetota bacterium]|nr:hypothetical protein [Planctomycetota bacterium]
MDTYETEERLCPYCGKDLEEDPCEHWVATVHGDEAPDGGLYFAVNGDRLGKLEDVFLDRVSEFSESVRVLVETAIRIGPEAIKSLEGSVGDLIDGPLVDAFSVFQGQWDDLSDRVKEEGGLSSLEWAINGLARACKCAVIEQSSVVVRVIDWEISHSPGLDWTGTDFWSEDAAACLRDLTSTLEDAAETAKELQQAILRDHQGG